MNDQGKKSNSLTESGRARDSGNELSYLVRASARCLIASGAKAHSSFLNSCGELAP
jgi:hypothetical protein